jgi:mono/diheme cytochrome c family protein
MLGERLMIRTSVPLGALLVALWPAGATAQQAADNLTDQERSGRQLLAQSCGVCHLPPLLNARTFGPRLTKDTAGGNAEVIRAVISDGTPRMPGFKHYLSRAEMDAIIAYMKTVPTPPPAPAPQTR